MKNEKKKAGVHVLAECMMCKKRRKIGPGEVAPGEHPMCNACFMPMMPVKGGRDA